MPEHMRKQQMLKKTREHRSKFALKAVAQYIYVHKQDVYIKK